MDVRTVSCKRICKKSSLCSESEPDCACNSAVDVSFGGEAARAGGRSQQVTTLEQMSTTIKKTLTVDKK